MGETVTKTVTKSHLNMVKQYIDNLDISLYPLIQQCSSAVLLSAKFDIP